MSTPTIELLVLPGSLFCTKVMTALTHKKLPYSLTTVHPSKLKKETPPPHLVPVMQYNTEVIGDSSKILQYIESHHPNSHGSGNGLYPESIPISKTFSSVKDLETFSHDKLSHLYYYFGGVSENGRKTILQPFIRQVVPKPLITILPFIPVLGARLGASQLEKRVHTMIDRELVKDEPTARKTLFQALERVESSFENEQQEYVLGTTQPTAGDFGVFAALKRLAHPVPELFDGVPAGFPGLFEETNVPKTKAFFERMDKLYYEGKVDWSQAKI